MFNDLYITRRRLPVYIGYLSFQLDMYKNMSSRTIFFDMNIYLSNIGQIGESWHVYIIAKIPNLVLKYLINNKKANKHMYKSVWISLIIFQCFDIWLQTCVNNIEECYKYNKIWFNQGVFSSLVCIQARIESF